MSVFLSYSRADNDFVDLIQRLLVSKGYDAWLDRRNIGAGSRWDNEIEDAIKSRSHMVVVLSPESAASQNVADEWNFAIDEGKTIVPLYYRECSIPMRLRRVQWVDFTKQPFAEGFKALTVALGESDNRPSDPIQLAKRDGFVMVEVQHPFDLERTRVAFAYSDYPFVQPFLSAVWSALLWHRVERFTFGQKWTLRDKLTKQTYVPPPGKDVNKLLLHEVGLEPGAQLEVVFLKEENND